MANILLINPSWKPTYTKPVHELSTPFFPVLSLATIAAHARNLGHKVTIQDLCFRGYDPAIVMDEVKRGSYDIVGFTGTTPLFPQVIELSQKIKSLSSSIFTFAGGPHVSALPDQSIEEANLDAVCVGEGDFSLGAVADGTPLSEISGLVYRTDGTIYRNPQRDWLQNLDDLPFPAWDLFNIKEYIPYMSRLICRRPPGAFFETTRGCVYRCDYCASKTTLGGSLRKKSVDRVIEEIKYTQSFGFQELFLVDDLFTTDVPRTKEICRRIIEEDLDIAWTCSNGIRVDVGDQEMFDLMARAGCYRVAFGFESGNDEILKNFGKGGRATVQSAFNVVKMARKAGIDVLGFFMVGLSHDTEKTMMETIEFGRQLETDVLKISICIPFPGTQMFDELRAQGRLNFTDWNAYNVFRPQEFFNHPNANWDLVEKCYKLAYKRMVYTNPGFILRRLKRGIIKRELFNDIYAYTKLMLSGGSL